MYGLCMSFASGFGLRYVHYVLMRSFAEYEFSSRWRLLLMVTQIEEDEYGSKRRSAGRGETVASVRGAQSAFVSISRLA